MALETATYIDGLVATNPTGTDLRSTAKGHLQLIKSTVKATFPNVSGAVTPTHTELNYVDGVTSAIQTQLDAKVGTSSALLLGQPRVLQTQTASTSASISFINGTGGAVINSTYDQHRIRLINVIAATSATNLLLRTTTNASTFDSGVSDYRHDYRQTRSGTSTSGGAATTAIVLNGGANGLSNSLCLNGHIDIYSPATAARCMVSYVITFIDSAGVLVSLQGSGMRDATTDVDGFQLIMASGNITSGTFILEGIVK